MFIVSRYLVAAHAFDGCLVGSQPVKVPWVFLGIMIFEILDSYSRLISFVFHGLSVNGPNILNLEIESLSPIDTIYLPLEIQ